MMTIKSFGLLFQAIRDCLLRLKRRSRSRCRVKRDAAPLTHLSVESLESRVVPSITICRLEYDASLNASRLRIVADAADDQIRVEITPTGQINVKNWSVMVASPFAASQAARIDIDTGLGNNRVDIVQRGVFAKTDWTPKLIQVFGKAGNETLYIDLDKDYGPADNTSSTTRIFGTNFAFDGGGGANTVTVQNWYPNSVQLTNVVDNTPSGSLAAAQKALRDYARYPFMQYYANNSYNRQWSAPFINGPSNRSASNYLSVIQEFEPMRHGRYQWDSETKCNVYVYDVMRAMGAFLPTKQDANPALNDLTPAPTETLNSWLTDGRGAAAGWREVLQSDLQTLVNHVRAGKPAMGFRFVAHNDSRNHMVVIRPDQPQYGPYRVQDLRTAQAGAKNFTQGQISDVVGWRDNYSAIRFFIYDPDAVSPVIESFSVSSSSVPQGQPLTMMWNTSDNRGVDHTALYLKQNGNNVDLRPWGGTVGSFAPQTLSLGQNGSWTWTVPAGLQDGSYQVWLSAWDAAGNQATASRSLTITPSQVSGPTNDNFASRTTISGSSITVTGSNVNATKEAGEPNHANFPGGKSVWFSWTAPASGSATITTTGSSFDTLLHAYTGSSVSGLSSVKGNDDDPNGGLTSRITFDVVAGTAFQIAVDGYGGASGSITLNVALIASGPANDNFENRSWLGTGTRQIAGSNRNATRQSGEPIHAAWGERSVWFSWAADRTGWVEINTAGSNFDTTLAVYRGGNLSTLSRVDENDDASGLGLQSRVRFWANAGEVFQIALDGWSSAVGDYALNVLYV